MVSLNDIPEHLRGSRDDEPTPERELVIGAVATVVVAGLAGVGQGALAYYVPVLTYHWLLNLVWGFSITWILFSVMHGVSRQVSEWALAVVLPCTVLIAMLRIPVSLIPLAAESKCSVWALFNWDQLVGLCLSYWIGAGVATVLCRNGEYTVADLAEWLMINPFTGRRQ